MNRVKYIVRAAFLLLAVFLLIDLNRKTEDSTRSIAQFKYETYKKMQTDTLDTRRKLDLLLTETDTFLDHSSHVKQRINYLIGLLGLFVVVEVIFLALTKKPISKKESS